MDRACSGGQCLSGGRLTTWHRTRTQVYFIWALLVFLHSGLTNRDFLAITHQALSLEFLYLAVLEAVTRQIGCEIT